MYILNEFLSAYNDTLSEIFMYQILAETKRRKCYG